jgi:hypothetical protein
MNANESLAKTNSDQRTVTEAGTNHQNDTTAVTSRFTKGKIQSKGNRKTSPSPTPNTNEVNTEEHTT